MGISIHRWSAVGVCLIMIVLLQMVPAPRQEISMLDVGQGDALLLQDGTTQVLIDGGPGSDVLARLAEQMPWFDKHIEVIVVTHPHRDHIEGLVHVLDRYTVGMVLMPQYAYTSDIERQLLESMIAHHIPYRFSWYGQRIQAGKMQFRVMSPIPGDEWAKLARNNPNNASVVMRADTFGLSELFMGDAELGIEKQLLDRIAPQAFDVDILKVGHHGSKTSTSPELLAAASPSVSLVSVGADNTYGHPADEVIHRLAHTNLFRTDLVGTVSLFFSKDSWRVACGNKTDLPFAQHVCINK